MSPPCGPSRFPRRLGTFRSEVICDLSHERGASQRVEGDVGGSGAAVCSAAVSSLVLVTT